MTDASVPLEPPGMLVPSTNPHSPDRQSANPPASEPLPQAAPLMRRPTSVHAAIAALFAGHYTFELRDLTHLDEDHDRGDCAQPAMCEVDTEDKR
jgi:hypothetical protein